MQLGGLFPAQLQAGLQLADGLLRVGVLEQGLHRRTLAQIDQPEQVLLAAGEVQKGQRHLLVAAGLRPQIMLPYIVDEGRVQGVHALEGGVDGLGGAAHGPGQTAHRKRLRPLLGHQLGGGLQNILLENAFLRRHRCSLLSRLNNMCYLYLSYYSASAKTSRFANLLTRSSFLWLLAQKTIFSFMRSRQKVCETFEISFPVFLHIEASQTNRKAQSQTLKKRFKLSYWVTNSPHFRALTQPITHKKGCNLLFLPNLFQLSPKRKTPEIRGFPGFLKVSDND